MNTKRRLMLLQLEAGEAATVPAGATILAVDPVMFQGAPTGKRLILMDTKPPAAESKAAQTQLLLQAAQIASAVGLKNASEPLLKAAGYRERPDDEAPAGLSILNGGAE